jgi:carboxyl-terminal processing protease
MPLRNVRGYALALTTARYYTPSGRSIQRDYGSTAFEDYVAPKDRKTCDEARGGEAKLTDAGRKVFGGDGITPDFCVEQETPNKFVAYLISKAAFGGFARGFSAAETIGNAADIAGAGKRSEVSAAKIRVVSRDFQVDDRTINEFKAYLDKRKLRYTPEDITANREAIAHQITEQVLVQVFGEAEARRRSLAWDPQVKKALELVPKSDLLLKDPQKFIAERVAENRPVAVPPTQ